MHSPSTRRVASELAPPPKPPSGSRDLAAAGPKPSGRRQDQTGPQPKPGALSPLELRRRVDQVPDVRRERIEAIKGALDGRIYRIDPEAIADRILESMIQASRRPAAG